MANLYKFLYWVAFISFIFISFAILVTIPSRWRIQKDLNLLTPELKNTFSDLSAMCNNDCEPPYPSTFNFQPVEMPTSDEKDFCRNACKNIQDLKHKIGMAVIFNKLTYLNLNESKYYFYSGALNCLIGLGGCPPAFLRELK